MKRFSLAVCLIAFAIFAAPSNAAVVLSEFEPNPAGGDPDTSMIELSGGVASAAFSYTIYSIENDGFNGNIDRASAVSGNFDGNGFAVVTVPDLENPSFTLVLSEGGTANINDDIDALNDGVLSLGSLGTILDAVGVSDSAADDASLYGALMGGSDILYNGQFEPLRVFRDGVTGDFFQTVAVNFGQPTEFVGVFDASGAQVDAALFSFDPTVTNFGAANPTAVPEPTAVLALAGLGVVGAMRSRRRSTKVGA